MDDGRFFAFVALLAILFWLLAGQRGIDPRLRRWALPAAYGVLAAGLLYALFQTIRYVLG